VGKVWAGVGQKNTPPVGGMATLPLRRCEVTAFLRVAKGCFLGVLRGLCGVVWVAVGGFCVLLRYGHFASRKCSRKGGMA
jgi:hypothetical protein